MSKWWWLAIAAVVAYVFRDKLDPMYFLHKPAGYSPSATVTGDTSGLGGGGAVNPLMGGSPAGCASRNDGIIGTACKL